MKRKKTVLLFMLKMPSTCCVVKCNSRSHDRSGKKINNGLSFFRFPSWKQCSTSHVSDVTKRRRMAWIAAVRRPNLTFEHTPPHMLVCSKHFHKGIPAYEMLECHPDWAPSLHLGHTEVKETNADRFNRFRKRSLKSQHNNNTGAEAEVDNAAPACPDNTTPATEMEGPVNPPSLPDTIHTDPETKLKEEAHLFPDYSAPMAKMEGQATRPRPPAPESSGREDDMKTKATGDDAPMGYADEQQECSMCGLRLQEIIRLQEENQKLKKEISISIVYLTRWKRTSS